MTSMFFVSHNSTELPSTELEFDTLKDAENCFAELIGGFYDATEVELYTFTEAGEHVTLKTIIQE